MAMTTKVAPSGPENIRVKERDSNLVDPKEQQKKIKWVKDNMKMKNWLEKNIKLRKCSCYVPVVKNICHCGYSKEMHTNNVQIQHKVRLTTKSEWKYENDVYTETTNAFGDIKLDEFGRNIAKFVRVDSETSMSTVLTLMSKVWRMGKPSLLISVVSGADNCEMKPRLQEACLHSLMRAVQVPGAWIITGGANEGVMKFVGKVVKEDRLISTDKKPIIAIGITPWEIIHKKHKLRNKEGSWPAEYCVEEQPYKGKSVLDPNHSHFILVDKGPQRTPATENKIDFRNELENEISKMKMNTGDGVMSVPVVLLVLEWGSDILETVQKAIQRNSPVVIVKGPDAEADNCEGQSMIPKEVSDSSFVHICEWNRGSGDLSIDRAILKVLLKANKKHVMYHLKLALDWNMIDIAKTEIFTVGNRRKTGSLDHIMTSAILHNRADFVELLLENGVILKTFLTKQRLLELYNKVSSGTISMVLLPRARRMKKEKFLTKITMKDVRHLMQELLDDHSLKYHSDTRHIPVEHRDKVCKKRWDNNLKNPCLDLFIWSVLNNSQDIAKLFWRLGKDAMATALLAHALFSAMLSQTENREDRELSAQIEKNRGEFMELAVGLLKECHSTDEEKTQCLLRRQLPDLWERSCVLIAVNDNNKNFIFQTACQGLFNNIWMGEMTLENGILKLLACVALPPLIPLLATFKGNEDDVQESEPPYHTAKSLKQSHPYLPTQETTHETIPDTKRRSRVMKFYRAPVIIFYHTVGLVIDPDLLAHYAMVDQRLLVFAGGLDISYMFFLGLYSYILISKLEEKVSVEEIILIVWVFTIFTQEIQQVFTTASMTMKTKLISYITDGWNRLDVVTMFLFMVGMILRGINHPQTLEAARVILGVNLVTFFMRLLQIFSVHKELGPKLVMIIRMVHNLAFFLLILMVFIVSYAIASHAILYPNTELGLDTVINIIKRPYWNIFGELNLEAFEGAADCTSVAELYKSGTYSRCPTESGKYFGPVLMGVYMFVCNILLLNLLIAIFNQAYQMVQEQTDMHWCFHRHSLINEYYIRPALPPPFIIFMHVYMVIGFLKKKCQHTPHSPVQGQNAFLVAFPKEREQELCRFEDVMADRFHHKRKLEEQESTNSSSRLDQLLNKIDKLQKQLKSVIGPTVDVQSNSKQKSVLVAQKSKSDAESAENKDIMDKTVHRTSSLNLTQVSGITNVDN